MIMSKELKEVWEELSFIGVGEGDLTLGSFLHFPEGTEIYDIWQWIENKYDVSVSELMGLSSD